MKVNMGYIVYIYTQYKINTLQSYTNTKNKDYLQEYVASSIFKTRFPNYMCIITEVQVLTKYQF